MTKSERAELKNLLEFRDFCKNKGQKLSKPKYERLTELLTKQLDADKILDDERTE